MVRDVDPIDLPLVLSVRELVGLLDIGRRRAYLLISEGAIRHVRVGRAIRIPGSALIEFLDGDKAAQR